MKIEMRNRKWLLPEPVLYDRDQNAEPLQFVFPDSVEGRPIAALSGALALRTDRMAAADKITAKGQGNVFTLHIPCGVLAEATVCELQFILQAEDFIWHSEVVTAQIVRCLDPEGEMEAAYPSIISELRLVQTHLSREQEALAGVQEELSAAQDALSVKQTELEQTQDGFAAEQEKFTQKQAELTQKQTQLSNAQTAFAVKQSNLEARQKALTERQEAFSIRQGQLEDSHSALSAKQTAQENSYAALAEKQESLESSQQSVVAEQAVLKSSYTDLSQKQTQSTGRLNALESAQEVLSDEIAGVKNGSVTAEKAKKDAFGRVIADTYATKTEATAAAQAACAALDGGAPDGLNTLKKLADALPVLTKTAESPLVEDAASASRFDQTGTETVNGVAYTKFKLTSAALNGYLLNAADCVYGFNYCGVAEWRFGLIKRGETDALTAATFYIESSENPPPSTAFGGGTKFFVLKKAQAALNGVTVLTPPSAQVF